MNGIKALDLAAEIIDEYNTARDEWQKNVSEYGATSPRANEAYSQYAKASGKLFYVVVNGLKAGN